MRGGLFRPMVYDPRQDKLLVGLPVSKPAPKPRPEPPRSDFRRVRLVIALVLCAGLAAYILFNLPSQVADSTDGGLDGCLRKPNGEPYVNDVHVGDQVATTGADGCFFFPALAAGDHVVEVKQARGVWRRNVTIPPYRGVGLGTVMINP
jgi:hypothetical protein